ncbi:sensor histidine kinase [Telluria aromaticivorans]|uniref:Histidine kinase n=1 Tax=Telluria aromaticivorans TaxID=2725995 RepID=A0A7Y2JZE4_9BURK|nr:histidine kinase [Telluria aromaticivorans]NNG23721.1 histidine kinase [Telluria aromaticivorans]
MQARNTTQQYFSSILSWVFRGFDAVATWVTQLSWWKFFLFALLTLAAGAILQEELFSGPAEEEVARAERESGRRSDAAILIDESGIRFNPRRKPRSGAATVPPEPSAPPVPPDAPPAPETPAVPAPSTSPSPAIYPNGESVHIELPPQIGEELSNAIEMAVEDAAEQKVSRYHKQASTWFMNFVLLFVLALFGTKALVGGKKRAVAEAQVANAAAEREAMQRQLSETRMQMMQAQVEPHFLFNTLASVEHLIQVDPPRASAMQRSLIQYLRAVLPQMRDNAVVTGLGREVDMVTAYLALLKMRMEERLTVVMRVPEGLRSAAFPPMMLQSMVENAIKHGLECKPEGGTLEITAEVVDNRLRVTVSDDGVGFGVVPSDGTGLGLQTIRDRLKLLHGDAGQLHIAANSPSGVIAMIEVPYLLSKQA